MWLTPFVLEGDNDGMDGYGGFMGCSSVSGNGGENGSNADEASMKTWTMDGTDRSIVSSWSSSHAKGRMAMLPYHCSSSMFPADVTYSSLVEELAWTDRSHGGSLRCKLSVPQFFATSREAGFLKLCTLLHRCTFTRDDFEGWMTRSDQLRSFLLCPVCGRLATPDEQYWIMAYPLLVRPEDASELSGRLGIRAASKLTARLMCLSCLEHSVRIPQHHKRNLYQIPVDASATTELQQIDAAGSHVGSANVSNHDYQQQQPLSSSSSSLRQSSTMTVSETSEDVTSLMSSSTTTPSLLSSSTTSSTLSPSQSLPSISEPSSSSSSSSSSTTMTATATTATTIKRNEFDTSTAADRLPALEVLQWFKNNGMWRTLERQHRRFAEQVEQERTGSGTALLLQKMTDKSHQECCHFCHSEPAVLRCGACKMPVYCSKYCQGKDWKRHRLQDCGRHGRSVASTRSVKKCTNSKAA